MWLGAGVAAYVVFRILAAAPGVAESAYSRAVGPFLVWLLSRITGVLPFAAVEVALAGYAVWLGMAVRRGVRDVRRGRRSSRHLVAGGGLRVARDAGVIITIFYVSWGFNYARAPLDVRLGWPAFTNPTLDELETWSRELVDAGNRAYRVIHGSEDAGHPTSMPRDRRALDRALEEGWQRAAARLDLPASVERRYGPVKRLVLTPVVARFGIAGFYFPWTGEANVLWNAPAVRTPHSMAHEKAHQRGIGPESDASFLGYVAAALAPDPHARYSALVFAQGQLLSALARADRERFEAVAVQRYPGIVRDLRDLLEYWAQFQGVGTTVGRSVNDRFLRTNRVQGGIQSYGRSVRLIMTFARESGAVDPGVASAPREQSAR